MIKKAFMDEVYHSSRYKPFHFYEDYKKILALFSGPVTHQYYSIELEGKHKSCNALYPILPLQEHQLQLCSWEGKAEKSVITLPAFREALVQAFYRWVEYFIKLSVDHFNKRESEKITLIQHPIINLSIGDLVSQLAQCRALIFYTRSYGIAIEKIIKLLCDLHKLTGGRSFLKGNIIDMLALITVFKKVYF